MGPTGKGSPATFAASVERLLDHAEDFASVAYTIRASILIVLVVAALVLVPDQSRDSIRTAMEAGGSKALRALWIGTLLLSLMGWYWARLSLYWRDLRKMPSPRGTSTFNLAVDWLPRVVGTVPLGVLALAFMRAIPPEDRPTEAQTFGVAAYLLHACGAFGAAVAFFAFTVFRRRLFMKQKAPPSTGPQELDRVSHAILWALILYWLITCVLFWLNPLRARGLGTIGMIMAAGAAWVAFLSYVIWRLGRLPTLRLLLLWAVVLSAFDCNDNHAARSVASVRLPPSRPVDEIFTRWLDGRPDKDSYPSYPVVLVCAEGGGIAAAYWTAHVLATIQDNYEPFRHHVFAISGVSGGSVGSATYAALARRLAEGANKGTDAVETAQSTLQRDFLAPVAAAALYLDLPQRFLPGRFESLDRAAPLETGFEDAWSNATGGRDDFSRPLDETPLGPFESGSVPALFFNTTQVETGHRLVVSNLRLSRPPARDVLSIEQLDPRPSMRLSTAAVLSSRFPLVTPAGYLMDYNVKSGKRRFVDAGYFENSGAATLQDVMEAMELYEGRSDRRPYHVIVLRIGFGDPPPQAEPPRLSYRWQGLGEALSPLRAMLNTRTARGAVAVNDLKVFTWTLRQNTKRDVPFLDFVLNTSRGTIPLGWSLSSLAQEEIRSQLAADRQGEAFGTKGVNAESLRAVLELLRPTVPPPRGTTQPAAG